MAGYGRVDSQDSQSRRVEIDIGNNKTMTIEITLRDKLTPQSMGRPRARGAAGGMTGEQAAAAAAAIYYGEESRVLAERAVEDQEFLDQMRGYLMAVSTLFLGIAYQAATQMPSWMPNEWYQVYKRGPGADPSPPAAPDTVTRRQAFEALNYVATGSAPDTSATTYAQAHQVMRYMSVNSWTFAISLSVVLVLLLLKRTPSSHLMKLVTLQLSLLCITVTCSFVIGSASDPEYQWYLYLIIFGNGIATVLNLWGMQARDLRRPRQMAGLDDSSSA